VAVDGWAVTFGTARRGLGGGHRPLLAIPNDVDMRHGTVAVDRCVNSHCTNHRIDV